MSGQELQAEAEALTPPVETPPGAQEPVERIEAGTEQQEAPQASELEDIAREMGWAPQADWKGPKEAWKTAKEFIRHGTVIQRELKSRNDAQQRDFEQRLERMDRANKRALDNQRAQIVQQFEARKREAVRNMDEQAYESAQRAEVEALKNFDAGVNDDGPPGGSQRKLAPEVIDFGLRNKEWWNVDPVMTGAAIALEQQMNRQFPELSDSDRLGLVEKEIKRRFSGGSSQQQAPAEARGQQVEGGLRPIKTTKTKGWAELPSEAKQAGAKFIKDGLFKTQDEYAKSYWEQE